MMPVTPSFQETVHTAPSPVVPGTVSFVIPNYNHARYLGQAIESALAQTYPHVEVIVVDDGSIDDSRAVAAAYGDRIRYIYQRNAGLSAARNTGVQAAQGEFIALLDADDLVEPAYAERLLSVLAQAPAAAGAYCGFRFVDQDNQPLNRIERRTTPPETLYGALLNGNYWVPESLLARRACYAAMGEFDTSLRACEDWDVWLRFSRHYSLVGTEDVLIRYRVVVGSMSSDPRRMLDNRLVVLAKHIGSQPPYGGDSPAHQAYAYAYFRAAVEYYQAGNPAAGYGSLLEAARIFPALLVDHATYYELACSEQARGSEGDVRLLDINARQSEMLDIVRRLSTDDILRRAWHDAGVRSAELRPAQMQASALWAVALLSFQSGTANAARTALFQASRLEPSLLRNRRFSALFARSLLGTHLVALLKRMKSSA
jgi:glycosyltransferase involved in cell wall biosynthesis